MPMSRCALFAPIYVIALMQIGNSTNRVARAATVPPAMPGDRLLIVAPGNFREPLAEYVHFKRQILPTDFASLEEILKSSHGVDDPERLKRFIYDAWRTRRLGYVLLVGDRDIMPVRYMVLDRVTPAAFDYAFYPSDLYYGDVAKDDGSFESWNAEHRGFHAQYFGEVRGEKNKRDPINYDQIHYRCQVAVGRWPVDSVAQVKTVVAKSVAFEKGIREGSHPHAGDVCLFNVAGWVDARDRLHQLAGGLPSGFRAEEFYFQDQNAKFKTDPPDTKHILEAFNRGAGVCLHVGHGDERSWQGSALSRSNIKQMNNADRLPVVISAGCSTAYFAPLGPYEAYTDVRGEDHRGTDAGEVFTSPPPAPAPYQKRAINESLGKSLLIDGPNGAVAYIGCNTGGQPCALTLVEGFIAGLKRGGRPRIGDCWTYAISYYYDKEHLATLAPNADWYPPSIFFQGMKYMLFGDPTLPLAPPAKRESRP
jgi:peptidase C25-like protein